MTIKKNILALALLFVMGAASAYADITFSAWGRAVVTPLAFMGKHSSASAATSTWGNTPAVAFTANGIAPSEKIGFNINLEFSNANAYVVDNAKAWVQPFTWFRLTAGQFNEDDFRGRIGASEFGSWLLPNGGKDEDNLFYRFKANQGAHFKILPLVWLDSPWNDLSIEGAFGSNALGTSVNQLRAILNLLNNEDNDYSGQTAYDETDESYRYYNGDRTMSLLDVYKAIQIGVGYRIPDTGFFRIQFIGNNREVFRYGEQGGSPGVDLERRLVSGLANDRDADSLEAAFLFDALEKSHGFIVDLGTKIPFAYRDKTNFIVYNRVIGTDGHDYAALDNANHKEYTVQRPYAAALGVTWTPSFLTAFTITTRVDVSFGGRLESDEDGVKITNGYNINAWLMPSYGLGAGARLGVDVGIDMHGADTVWKKGVPPAKAQTDASQYFDFGVGPWAELAFAGGRVRTGMVIMVPGSPRYIFNPNSTSYGIVPKFTGDPVISVPISFTYSF
ncbi:MAG: hypothetical protein LBH75_08705 [Treponema sp.]|jgi:hypothetical protein|nr:hypothetical protein [Treponema sp.]